MTFQIRKPVAELSDDQIAELLAEGTQTFRALLSSETPNDADVTEAERIAPLLKQLQAESDKRTATAASVQSRAAALLAEFAEPTESDGGDDDGSGDDPGDAGSDSSAAPAVAETSPAPVAAAVVPPTPAAPAVPSDDVVNAVLARLAAAGVASAPTPTPVPASTVASLAGRRPELPQRSKPQGSLTIVASADVPDFATGSRLDSLIQVGKAWQNRIAGFPEPQGDPHGQLQKYGVASFRKEFPDDLMCNSRDDYETVMHAADEKRLPGGNLVASAGWCAPSETIYDLCAPLESTDGILSIAEVGAPRGGIKFPIGPDFSQIYAAVGFCQTETQAIAGTAKPCYEVPCNTFTEVRLDACGICIKAGLLLQAGYPELVQRWMSGAMMAHQHKMNAKVINAIVAALGTKLAVTDLSSTAGSTLAAIELMIEEQRTKYRMAFGSTLEVIAPHWLLGAIRTDLAMRTAQDLDSMAVTDAQVQTWFAVRGANVQWVYDWQPIPDLAIVYPKTVDIAVYPAGAFVKATNGIISLSAVYDAASLAQNLYTGLFYEEGIAVAQTCYSGNVITVPICSGGKTGIASTAVCYASLT